MEERLIILYIQISDNQSRKEGGVWSVDGAKKMRRYDSGNRRRNKNCKFQNAKGIENLVILTDRIIEVMCISTNKKNFHKTKVENPFCFVRSFYVVRAIRLRHHCRGQASITDSAAAEILNGIATNGH